MFRTALMLLLLIWAVPAEMRSHFRKFIHTSTTPRAEVIPEPTTTESVSESTTKEENATIEENTEMFLESLKNETTFDNATMQNIGALIEKVNVCMETQGDVINETLNLGLSNLEELLETQNETLESVFRLCNISKELVDKLKDKLPQLEIFQGIFVLIPRNNSSESPDQTKSTQQPTPPASRIYSHESPRALGVENNLKLKLGDEWIPLESKVPHISHIYLGTSVFPILTEESRILDNDYTLPSPTTTEKLSNKINRLLPEDIRKGGMLSQFHGTIEKKWQELESYLFPPNAEFRFPLRFSRSVRTPDVENLKSSQKLQNKDLSWLNFLFSSNIVSSNNMNSYEYE